MPPFSWGPHLQIISCKQAYHTLWTRRTNKRRHCELWFVGGFIHLLGICILAIVYFFIYNVIYVCGCFVCTYVCVPCHWLVCVEVRRGSPRTEVTDGYRLTCKCWELNLGSLEEHSRPLNHWGISLTSWLLGFNYFTSVLLNKVR